MEVRKNLFQVGASRVVMQYPDGFFPHMGFRGRYLTGVRDDLCVRTILISQNEEQMLFVSLELGDVGSQWIGEISKQTGIPADRIFLTATHTHSSPHVGGHWPEDVVDVEQGENFARLCFRSVMESIQLAKQALQPAVMRYGEGKCYINVNRDYRYDGDDGKITAPYIQASVPGGVSDKTVYIISFDTPDGEPLACMFSYAVHSNVTFYQSWDRENGMLITGDIAGVAMRYVEQRRGGVAMYHLGAAADQSPQYLANHRVFDKDGNAAWEYCGAQAGYTLMEAQGAQLGIAVQNALADLRTTAGNELDTAQTIVTLRGKLDGVRQKNGEDEAADNYAAQYKEKMDADFDYIENGTLDMPLYLIRLHGVNIVGIPAEIVTSIGTALRTAVTGILGGATMVITQCNDAYSYIADDEGYAQRTFEGVASHVMPGSADRILFAMKELAWKMKND